MALCSISAGNPGLLQRSDLFTVLLCTAGDTRFGTNFIMLGRLVDVKRELQQTVVDEKWEGWIERGDRRVKEGAETCKAAVMDDRWYTTVAQLMGLVA